jgi:predicted nucleic acid-binding protein
MMMTDQHIKMRYLDASALVKLYVDEGDSKPIRAFFVNRVHFCATSVCLVEALSVLKAKWIRKQITKRDYFEKTGQLLLDARRKIEINDVGLAEFAILDEVERLASKHDLDISDALQLLTIVRGKYSFFADDSRSVLITADRSLAVAARAEKIRVWNCIAEAQPSWA